MVGRIGINMVNMIFDATVLLNWNNKDASRSGSFFVAKNIYERLSNSPSFRLYLYFDMSNVDAFLANASAFTKPFVNDLKNPVWKFFLFFYKKMWRCHSLFFKHSFFRKPFALGIVISRFVLRRFNKIDQTIVSECQAYFSPLHSVPKHVRRQKHLIFFTMLYDTIPFWNPEDCGEAWTRELKKIVRDVENRDYFICDSYNSFLDFNKINSKISSERTTIALLAADDKFCEGKDENCLDDLMKKYKFPIGKKYVFCLSSVSPRKNFERIIRTFLSFVKTNDISDLFIVVSGSGSAEIVPNLLKKYPEYEKMINAVVFPTGYISDDEKISLYQHAEWFVYTSQYEGFGLPPLEAMKCGCPVITSNNSSLPEVVGDAGVMIDWDSDEQHIDAYKKIYEDPVFRKKMKEMGLKQAKKFSWDKTFSLVEKYVIDKTFLFDIGCSD